MTKQEYTRGTPLRVFWVDSSHNPGWCYGRSYPTDVERICTLGFVVGSEDEGLVMTSSLSRQNGILAPLIVPWECITDIQELPEEWARWSNLPPI